MSTVHSEGQRELATLSAQLDAVIAVLAGQPLREALDGLLESIQDASADDMLASVLLADGDGRRLLHGSAPSLPGSYNDAIDGIEIGPFAGSCGAAAYLRAPVIVGDVTTDPRWEPYRDLALEAGLLACWSTPIMSRSGQMLGTFAMYYPRPQEPTAADLRYSAVLARTVSVLIERSRHDEALQRELAAERAVALTLQHRLLPQVPESIGPVRLRARYLTGDPDVEVGGDWYDALEVADGMVLMVGDVQGHDLNAATLMGQLRTLTRAYITDGQSPADVLTNLDRHLEDFGEGLLASALIVHINTITGRATVASAGHLPPLVLRPEGEGHSCTELQLSPGPLLGVGSNREEQSSMLPPGGKLFLYTDGLIESPMWGLSDGVSALAAALRSVSNQADLDLVIEAGLSVMPPGQRRDDIAILVASGK